MSQSPCGCQCALCNRSQAKPQHAPPPVPEPKPEPVPEPKPEPVPEPKPEPKTEIPAATASALARVIGLSAVQCDTVLQLISLPENGNTRWPDHYNYIEALGDGRGFTVTLFGACSGTGDLLQIFEAVRRLDPGHRLVQYIPSLKRCKNDHIDPGCRDLPRVFAALGPDPVWRRAVWEVYIALYWTFAADFCAKTGPCAKRRGPVLASAAARGFMVDSSLNHGAWLVCMDPVYDRMKNPTERDETKWLLDFIEARRVLLKSGYQSLDTSRTGHRCDLWAGIVRAGNLDLARPITCFDGYWGRGVRIT